MGEKKHGRATQNLILRTKKKGHHMMSLEYGVGFFIARPSHIVVARRSQATSFNSLLGGVSLRENAAPRRFLYHSTL